MIYENRLIMIVEVALILSVYNHFHSISVKPFSNFDLCNVCNVFNLCFQLITITLVCGSHLAIMTVFNVSGYINERTHRWFITTMGLFRFLFFSSVGDHLEFLSFVGLMACNNNMLSFNTLRWNAFFSFLLVRIKFSDTFASTNTKNWLTQLGLTGPV